MKKIQIVVILFSIIQILNLKTDQNCIKNERPFFKIGSYKKTKCACNCAKFSKGFKGRCLKPLGGCGHLRFKINNLS